MNLREGVRFPRDGVWGRKRKPGSWEMDHVTGGRQSSGRGSDPRGWMIDFQAEGCGPQCHSLDLS